MSPPTEPMPTPSVVTDIAAGMSTSVVSVLPTGGPIWQSRNRRWSTTTGGDWRDEFFGAYGIAPDQYRMDHYLRQWEDGD